jgi:hypothetical protein
MSRGFQIRITTILWLTFSVAMFLGGYGLAERQAARALERAQAEFEKQIRLGAYENAELIGPLDLRVLRPALGPGKPDE